ncbi:hypothetical protein NDU88_002592 [Pleurodeles waltl]|uniref:Uncharacterized protein n=1 Tax=Pleurodeles waltl TaxID=8319 RepID=A0AAV7T2J0_PLEWA|nr:hypothetical protein NDU88_002592 [Pleurodeles waltl]
MQAPVEAASRKHPAAGDPASISNAACCTAVISNASLRLSPSLPRAPECCMPPGTSISLRLRLRRLRLTCSSLAWLEMTSLCGSTMQHWLGLGPWICRAAQGSLGCSVGESPGSSGRGFQLVQSYHGSLVSWQLLGVKSFWAAFPKGPG